MQYIKEFPSLAVRREEYDFRKGRQIMPVDSSQPDKPVIIITDDHRATRHLIRSVLAPHGYELLEAANGRAMLDLYTESQPDLILLDIVMPVMDGLEACRRLRTLPGGENVPVLIFTAYDEGAEMEQAFLAGASDFIGKPVNPAELQHRVKRLLHLRKLELQRELAEIELQSSYTTIRSLSRKVLNAYEEEKVRLARELHDEVGMTLTTLKLNLQLLHKKLSTQDSVPEKQLMSLIENVNHLLSNIRDKAVFLRPPSLDELGLVAVIENMVNELSQYIGLRGEFTTGGNYEKLPVEIETALYRCIQEALTNVARHASAGRLSVRLDCSAKDVRVKVRDDGIGFDPRTHGDDGKHLGLQGMKERVDLLSGTIEINSSPGKGTEIQITIPLLEQEVKK